MLRGPLMSTCTSSPFDTVMPAGFAVEPNSTAGANTVAPAIESGTVAGNKNGPGPADSEAISGSAMWTFQPGIPKGDRVDARQGADRHEGDPRKH